MSTVIDVQNSMMHPAYVIKSAVKGHAHGWPISAKVCRYYGVQKDMSDGEVIGENGVYVIVRWPDKCDRLHMPDSLLPETINDRRIEP